MTLQAKVDILLFVFYGAVAFSLFWESTSHNPDSGHYKHRKQKK